MCVEVSTHTLNKSLPLRINCVCNRWREGFNRSKPHFAAKIHWERELPSSREIHSISSAVGATTMGISPGHTRKHFYMQLSLVCSPLKPPPSVLMAGWIKGCWMEKMVFVCMCVSAVHFNTYTHAEKNSRSVEQKNTLLSFCLCRRMDACSHKYIHRQARRALLPTENVHIFSSCAKRDRAAKSFES